jgi:hypothetical protein
MTRFFICLLLLCLPANMLAQEKTAGSFDLYFKNFPKAAPSYEKTYDVFFPKPKKNIYDTAQMQLKEQIDKLAEKAGLRSQYIALLAEKKGLNKYERDTHPDKKLFTMRNKIIGAIGKSESDLRDSFTATDSVAYKSPNLDLHEYIKKTYLFQRKSFAIYFGFVRKQITELESFLQSNGYEAIVKQNNTSHPAYVQVLEVYAAMVSTINNLVLVSMGIEYMAADEMNSYRQGNR